MTIRRLLIRNKLWSSEAVLFKMLKTKTKTKTKLSSKNSRSRKTVLRVRKKLRHSEGEIKIFSDK